jgi:hypothetical protein
VVTSTFAAVLLDACVCLLLLVVASPPALLPFLECIPVTQRVCGGERKLTSFLSSLRFLSQLPSVHTQCYALRLPLREVKEDEGEAGGGGGGADALPQMLSGVTLSLSRLFVFCTISSLVSSAAVVVWGAFVLLFLLKLR